MESQSNFPVGKVHRNLHNMDLNDIKSRTSYNRYHNEKSVSNEGQSLQDNDNISEKANSIHTSYQYKKNKKGPNSSYSKCSYNNQNQSHNQNENKQYDDQLSLSISDNDNLICANCINTVLIEEKQKRKDFDQNNYNNNNPNGCFTDGFGNEKYLIDEKIKQRELNKKEAIQNLAKINAGLNSKERLIQLNENSRNPLNDGAPDYQYQKFQDEYQKRQKMINDNMNKFYPKSGNERSEVASYYDNYVYNNPKYNTDNNNDGFNSGNIINNMTGDYGRKNINKQEYYKSLEDQINQKKELKKKEKEDEKRRDREQYNNYQKEMRRQEEDKYLKEQRQKEELMKANKALIDHKNKQKMKELQDNLKYRELYERQNDEYQKELKNKELENERKKNDFYNEARNEYEKRMKKKEDEKYNNIGNFGKEGNQKQAQDQNRNKIKERMGRCCKCHKIFPRRLLTINRYFYKENRK